MNVTQVKHQCAINVNNTCAHIGISRECEKHHSGQQTKENSIPDCTCELSETMSTGQDSTFEYLTETSPTYITHQTTGSSMPSSSSLGPGLYFQCAVLVVGIVGVAANGLVLYAMVASKQHKKQVLIFNQNVLDLVNCLFLVVTIPVELSNNYLTGTGGYWLCLTLFSYAGPMAAYLGSLINLAAISIERYLKIVHHVWAKNKLHNWMIYFAIAFAWICGIVIAAVETVPTIAVLNGVCYTGIYFLSEAARKVDAILDFVVFYVLILLIFIFCYGRILLVIHRQAKVMAAHSCQGSNIAQDHSNKIQTSVIKTMILVCVLFAITYAPVYIYSLLINFHKLTVNETTLYTIPVLSVPYIYICVNPIIYATKFDPVKRVLLRLISCKNNNMQLSESGGNT